MQIGNVTLQGVRTFILTLVSILGYIVMSYSQLDPTLISGMKELALMGFTYFFAKTLIANKQ